MTIRDKKNKAICEKLLKYVSESYSIDNEFDIINKKKKAGNNFRTLSEPRRVFFYLVKKHTNMKYREINDKLGCTSPFDFISRLVRDMEVLLRNKKNIELIHQVKIIERDIKKYIDDLDQALISSRGEA